MVAQKGKDMLVKLDADGLGNFVTVAGLRTRRLAFNSSAIDVTDTESAGRWRELLEAGGVRRASLTGTGIFKDAQSDDLVRQLFFAGAHAQWQLAIPDFGLVTGPFQISALEYAGSHDGEVTFEIGLESAGAISFGAV